MANRLTLWGILGFMLAASGAVVAVANWPDTKTEVSSTLDGGIESSVNETGNEVAANFGLVMLGVGSTMLWVVLIALGVYCGLRMNAEHSQIGAVRSRRGSMSVDGATAERLNREAQRRIAAKRAAEKHEG
ncbi:MAG: hypothetical protein ACRDPQ_07335 [Nocardioidaceae bacterium]